MGLLLRSLGLETLADAPLGDYSANVQPASRSDAPPTIQRAMTLPAAFRAIQLTAGMGSQLELGVWRNGQEIPTPSLVKQPDPWRPLDSWLERLIVGMATDGNGIMRKVRSDATGAVIALEVMDPFKCAFGRTDRGAKFVDYWGDPDGKTRRYQADEYVHIWALEFPGLERALGPIGWCRASVSGHLDIRDYASDWFRSDDVPSGVLTTDQRLDDATAKAYKAGWLNETESPKRLGPSVRVLGQGLKYEPIMLKPADAQWLESQAFGVLDIARMFGLPGDYLLAAVEGSSLTYANLEMIDAQFLRTTLFPVYLRKIESALSSVLPYGQSARFKTAALLRPDAKTRAEIDNIYLNAGVIREQEIRDREGWGGTAPGRPAPAAPTPQEAPA